MAEDLFGMPSLLVWEGFGKGGHVRDWLLLGGSVSIKPWHNENGYGVEAEAAAVSRGEATKTAAGKARAIMSRRLRWRWLEQRGWEKWKRAGRSSIMVLSRRWQ
jgi:hypothetical protein